MTAIRRTPNRRLAPSRPKTAALMARVSMLLKKRKMTQVALARVIQCHHKTLQEHLSCRRSAPGSELTLKLIAWCEEPATPA